MQQLIHIPCDPDYPSLPETYINPGAVFATVKTCDDHGQSYWKVFSVALNLVGELSPRQMELLAEKTGVEKNTIIPAPATPPSPIPGTPAPIPRIFHPSMYSTNQHPKTWN